MHKIPADKKRTWSKELPTCEAASDDIHKPVQKMLMLPRKHKQKKHGSETGCIHQYKNEVSNQGVVGREWRRVERNSE